MIWREKFSHADNCLTMLEFNGSSKIHIHMVLSAILNLGNIEFESLNDDVSFRIDVHSRKFLCNAAALLNISEIELEDAL